MRVGLRLAIGCLALSGLIFGADRNVGEKPPVVRAMEFKGFHGVSAKDIVDRLHDRDIQMMERAYSSQNVETAQGIVQELLAEKGQPGVRVIPTVTRIHTHSVRVTFTAAQ